MIPLEKLRAVKHLCTHFACPDGVASALIIKDALPDVRVSFMQYDSAELRGLPAESGILFCDFSPPRDRIGAFVEAGSLVLDHHPTQRDITMKFVEAGLGAYGENERGECGAWLAYEHVWLPMQESWDYRHESRGQRDSRFERVREFAELAGIRDTWKKNDPRWLQSCWQAEGLMFCDFEETALHEFLYLGECEKFFDEPEPLTIGKRLFEKKLEAARRSISESHVFITKQNHTLVFVFQGVSTTSDAAELLEKSEELRHLKLPGNHGQPDLVVGFHYRVDAGKLQLQFSMRSHTGYDVGAFAKAHGGGGHKAAAGFTVEESPELSSNPYHTFKLLLEQWENGQAQARKEWEAGQ